jgi:Ca-activated chloride channel family protein
VRLSVVQVSDAEEADREDGTDLFGQPRFVRMRFPIDRALMQALADAGGGTYVVAAEARGRQDMVRALLAPR